MNELLETPSWAKTSASEIVEVQGILSQELSDNPAMLYGQLTKIEVWQSRMLYLLAQANARLDQAEYQALMSLRGQDITVGERDIQIKHQVSTDRLFRDIIDGICKSIKNRLFLGENLRKQNIMEKIPNA